MCRKDETLVNTHRRTPVIVYKQSSCGAQLSSFEKVIRPCDNIISHPMKSTFRVTLLQKKPLKPNKLPPVVTVRGKNLGEGFKTDWWNKYRDEVYRGRGT